MPGWVTDYAKSGRSICQKCKDFIDEDDLRIGKKVQSDKFDGEIPLWHHFDCFWKSLGKEVKVGAVFVGAAQLRWDDQQRIEAKAKEFQKNNKSTNPPSQADTDQEKHVEALKKEAMLLWDIKDKLANAPISELKEMLTLNNHPAAGGKSVLLDRCAEGMLFGAIPKCPDCKEYTLKCLNGVKYKCSGKMTTWGACAFESKKVERLPWKVPEDATLPYLQKFVFKKVQAVKKKTVKLKSSVSDLTGGVVLTSNGIKVSGGLFNSMVIGFAGKLNISHSGLKALISKHKGVYSPTVGRHCTYLISNKATLIQKPGKIRAALRDGIAILEEEFIHDCISKNLILDEQLYRLSGTPKRIIWNEKPEGVQEDGQHGAESKVKKIMVKGNSAVHPDSKLAKKAHIYLGKDGKPCNTTLGMTDLSKGTNSYYEIQLIEKDSKDVWFVFRKWGRVGTTIGGTKLERFESVSRALKSFNELYTERTGNKWEDRIKFVKQPGKYYPLDIDFGAGDDSSSKTSSGGKKVKKVDYSKTKLSKPVAQLMELLFDVRAMELSLKELEIDTEKMPLGKLSEQHLKEAYSVLSQIQDILKSPNPNQSHLLGLNNEFYTKIPHSIKAGLAPPTIDSIRLLDKKREMLDQLLELQASSKLINKRPDDIEDPLSYYYQKLNCGCAPLDADSKEWSLISKYIQNTHAITHNTYSLSLISIYSLSKDDGFQTGKNRQLLWHGSRLSNFAGILSSGLRIAPPEAPVTGYMFGKGVYFADLVSKSANYCHATPENPYALLLLSEVVLGLEFELTRAKFIEKLPKGYQSCKGVGESMPDPNAAEYLKDVKVPLGRIVKNSTVKETELLYNEFIVYDTQQIKMRYLVMVKFHFK